MQKDPNSTHAQILPFKRISPASLHRSRGRPRKNLPTGKDLGTPELAVKRAQGITAETLDLCLERGLITPQQHWCGIHLRWLFTLRHGAPSLRALNPAHIAGHSPKLDDPEWRTAREQEYRDAVHTLAPSGQVTIIINVCVYNERPPFLANNAQSRSKRATESLEGLKKGLDILVKLWIRSRKYN